MKNQKDFDNRVSKLLFKRFFPRRFSHKLRFIIPWKKMFIISLMWAFWKKPTNAENENRLWANSKVKQRKEISRVYWNMRRKSRDFRKHLPVYYLQLYFLSVLPWLCGLKLNRRELSYVGTNLLIKLIWIFFPLSYETFRSSFS